MWIKCKQLAQTNHSKTDVTCQSFENYILEQHLSWIFHTCYTWHACLSMSEPVVLTFNGGNSVCLKGGITEGSAVDCLINGPFGTMGCTLAILPCYQECQHLQSSSFRLLQCCFQSQGRHDKALLCKRTGRQKP